MGKLSRQNRTSQHEAELVALKAEFFDLQRRKYEPNRNVSKELLQDPGGFLERQVRRTELMMKIHQLGGWD